MAAYILFLNTIKAQVMNLKWLIRTFASAKCSDLKNKGPVFTQGFTFLETAFQKLTSLKENHTSTDFPT